MTLQDKLNIIQNQFHLEIEEVEPTVYRVINTDQEVNIPKLQYTLAECVLITSDKIRTDKENEISMLIAHIYYIILDYTRDDLKYKYHKLSRIKFRDAVIDSYSKSKEDAKHISIDTIYRAEELTT